MKKIKYIVITCDKTKHILKAQKYLYDKYVGDLFDYTLIDLTNEPVNRWTMNVYEKIKDIEDEYVIFTLDDYLPIKEFNMKMFNDVIVLVKDDENFGRYEFGYGGTLKKIKNIIHSSEKYDVLEYLQNTPYRVSCQISLWKTEYLFSFLKNIWSPWQFELKGSTKSNNNGKRIITTDRDYCFRWIEESALSGRHPNMINIQGIEPKVLDELVRLKYLDDKKFQYGMKVGNNPIAFNIDWINNMYKEFYR